MILISEIFPPPQMPSRGANGDIQGLVFLAKGDRGLADILSFEGFPKR